MIFNVIIKESKDDKFTVQSDNKNCTYSIPSYRDLDSSDEQFVNKGAFSTQGLLPSENAIDFVNMALAVYVFDQLVNRKKYGYFNWNRYFKLYLPVLNVSLWEDKKSDIESFLSFLSGDKWELNFRKRNTVYEKHERSENNIEVVSLLSGGLDSFIGAVDLLQNGAKHVAFVSHHKGGNSGDYSTQVKLIELLQEEYNKSEINPNYFYVQAYKDEEHLRGDDNQRARSIIFIALALAVANSYGNDIPIKIPENGLISLNVPLTTTRYGSHSTKTTHPLFIDHLNRLFEHLGLGNKIINPYKFDTKGEMILKSGNVDFIKKHAQITQSCSKSGYYVRLKRRKELHCGHCTPCIIRRASMKKAGIDVYKNHYVKDVVKVKLDNKQSSARDTVAFKIALSRIAQSDEPLIFQLLKSGAIPSDSKDLDRYLQVYQRGMKEVKEFLFDAKVKKV